MRECLEQECAECVFGGMHWHEFKDNWELFQW